MDQLGVSPTASLLRTLAVKYVPFGNVAQNMFHNPHYVKVQKIQYNTIVVDIRDHTGNKAPSKYGPVTVKRH